MLTRKQKLEFYENGYLKIPGAVPKLMVDQARRAINHSVGNVGMHDADPEKFRQKALCRELTNTPVITDLFNKTPVLGLLESLLGEGNVKPVGNGQIAMRFPQPLGVEPGVPSGHLDGLGSGTNGMAKGVYRRGFTAFAVIYLADVPEPNCGNFTVRPGTHRFFEDYFKKEGHEVLGNGMPKIDLPTEPVQITGNAGDVVVAHHLLVHCGGPNVSPDIRYAAIFRLRHVDCETNGYNAYTDIWREWPGIREALEEENA